ncbi:enoyl-CoA hydratase-related protein [Candidatus Palauibacter sp.]|uniref:enoyl-CoA hydratase-related protein n=1 Tax=Candidatus Palauibacter sp. TaxID=3101350 RepID=UPI003C6F47D0
MSDPVKTERRGRVLEVILDRPPANAIDVATSVRMGEVFCDFRDDDDLWVAILTGGGERIFSAGWDLKAAAGGEHERMDYGAGGFGGITELWDLTKPVIAAVNGLAVGGGCELMLAADLVVASEKAEFWFPEARLGNMADAGAVQRLPRKLPPNVAMELLLTGRRMEAAEAHEWGLVNWVVAPDQVLPKAREVADDLARSAPLSLRAIKEVVLGIEGMSVRDAFRVLREGRFPAYERMLLSEDHAEGPRAFTQKREPNFTGR